MPDKTQLEILEALGQLGAAVKEHLIDATRSGLYAVRRRAIEMLLPHLSDDDLFGLDHILADRSREPIKTFLTALLERDAARTASWLQQKHFGAKATAAVAALIPLFAPHFPSNVLLELMTTTFQRISGYWEREWLLVTLARQFDYVQNWQLIRYAAIKDTDPYVRRRACALLLRGLNCHELQQELMGAGANGPFGYDLKQPITSAHVTKTAKRLNLSVDEVQQQYEAIAEQLSVELILEWRQAR